MKVVLDTNVLIAALIARAVCADLVEYCVLSHTVVSSDFILAELRRHLVGKFGYAEDDADDAIVFLQANMQIVTPAAIDPPVCRDPDDDQILGTAVAGQAECIVTGDKDLLVLGQHEGIHIFAPGDFGDFESAAGS